MIKSKELIQIWTLGGITVNLICTFCILKYQLLLRENIVAHPPTSPSQLICFSLANLLNTLVLGQRGK